MTDTDRKIQEAAIKLTPILDFSSGQVLNPHGLLEQLKHGPPKGPVGTITRISRFSTEDGPGIRTTVFVKGCPLKCEWCSNPETWKLAPEIAHKDRSCTMCSDTDHYRCVTACPENAPTSSQKAVWITEWEKEDGEGTDGGPRIDRDVCTSCGLCVEACPFGAIFWYGWESTVEQLMEMVRKDKPYFDSSNGGITISGGDPLMQASFVAEVFRMAQAEGIHTCLDTSGSGSVRQVEAVLPHTDLFHYDLKNMDKEDHIRWTKGSNTNILRNLKIVAEAGKHIIIRIPMIPGIIDTDENLTEIAKTAKDANERVEAAGGPEVELELLPYHRGGVGKFYELDKDYTLEPLRTQSEKELRRMIGLVQDIYPHAKVEGRDY